MMMMMMRVVVVMMKWGLNGLLAYILEDLMTKRAWQWRWRHWFDGWAPARHRHHQPPCALTGSGGLWCKWRRRMRDTHNRFSTSN
jgi:hypothetical protein